VDKKDFHFYFKEMKNKYKYFKNLKLTHNVKKSEEKMFPELNLTWKDPNIINNITFHLNLTISILKIIKIIKLTNTKHLIIILDENYQIKKLKTLLILINKTQICTVEIISQNLLDDTFFQFIENTNTSNIISINCFNSPHVNKINFKNGTKVNYFEGKLTDFSQSDKFNFVVNLKLFSESQNFNTYFNRKLYIDVNGEIKNSIKSTEKFGNIKKINLKEIVDIISSKTFQKIWLSNKDKIDTCKDCEFRYMCVDNKIPYQRSENEWYHKKECNYNPYIAKWEGEEGYKTLAECGVISDENGFSIDHEKIASINKDLWGEE
jgi:SPASM domain peptide maturase of grasp-with-spasm system